MFGSNFCKRLVQVAVFLAFVAIAISGRAALQTAPPASSSAWQRPAASATPPTPAAPTRADILRGAYGPYRVNNDLLSYHLDVRVDPEKPFALFGRGLAKRKKGDVTGGDADMLAAKLESLP